VKFEEALAAYRFGKTIESEESGVPYQKDGSGCTRFIGINNDEIMGEWIIAEEPKPPKLMAPCIFKYTLSDPSSFGVSDILFGSREEAAAKYAAVVQWPAIPDAQGFYSVLQE
jgi:hypothetical protein